MCYISGMDMLYRPSENRLQQAVNQLLKNADIAIEDVDAILIGASGDSRYDFVYQDFCAQMFPNTPVAWYKHLFGESYTAAGLGVYTAACCLQAQQIPSFLCYSENEAHKLHNILIYNHFQNKEHSLILLSNV